MTGCCLHTHYTGLVDTFVIPRFLRKTLDLQGSMQLFRNNYFLGITLAGTSKSDNIHGRQLRAVQPGNVAHMNHIREVVPGDGYALRYDLAGPQGADAVKRSGIGETSYAVKK